ncbi:MAG: Mfa1 family fimbria major subunit [Prevotella sp.]|nr:Mfa1 family fimbria major subunit [Prevotella sp.]
MNIDLKYIIRFARRIFFLAVLLPLLLSCADTDEGGQDDVRTANSKVNVKVSLSVNAPGSQNGNASTRTADAGPYQLTGIDGENRIVTLTVFLVPYDGTKEVRTATEYKTIPIVSGEVVDNGNGSYTISAEMSTTMGQKHIYVGANLRQAQMTAFVSNEAFKSTATTQADVLAEIMDLDSDGNGSNIVMFGAYNATASSAGATEVEIVTGTTDYDLTSHSAVSLERLVSKTLLTFSLRSDFTGVGDTDSRTNEVAFNDMFESRDGYGTANYHGWCQLSDISYILNTTNKQVYLERKPSTVVHSDDNTALDNMNKYWNQDPNQAITSYISYDATNMAITKDDGYSDHFINLTRDQFVYSSSPFDASLMAAYPIAYDESLLNTSGTNAAITTSSAHQQTGLYCLENTVNNDYVATDWGGASDGFTVDDVAEYVTTHMVVAVRYIPKTFYVKNGDVLTETTFATRTAAETALAAYSDAIDAVTYPANTYWVNIKEYKYYNSEARRQAITNGTYNADQFVKYVGGYNYFYTFIDPLQATANGVLTYEGNASSIWGMDRNSYHLLNVPAITLPSTPNLTDYIRVNSISTLDWNNRGSTTVKVTPQ